MSTEYDEWAEKCRADRGEIVTAGSKRSRKPNPKYGSPSKQSRTTSSTTSPLNTNTVATAIEAPNESNQPTILPPPTAPVLDAVSLSPSTTSDSPTSAATMLSSPEKSPPPPTVAAAQNASEAEAEYSGDCNLEVEQLVQFNRDMDTEQAEEFQMWKELRDGKHAFPSPDGDYIKCLLCVGRGPSKGVIKCRRKFYTGNWEEHCNSKAHQNALSHLEAKKDSKHPQAKMTQKKSNMLTYFNVVPKKSSEDEDESNKTDAVVASKPDVIDVDNISADTNARRDNMTCAGVFNSVNGKKKPHIALQAKYVAISSTQRWRIGSYGGLPSIVSKSCAGIGIFAGTDGGMVCQHCSDLRKGRGSSNPGTVMNKWYSKLRLCFDRRNREVITAADRDDAMAFIKIPDSNFTPAGLELKEEARALVEYCNYISTIPTCRTNFNYAGDSSVPGLDSFLDSVAEAYKKDPKFSDSVIVALMKAAVAKTLHGSNAKTEEKVINFYRFLQTYNPKTFEVVSANLNGPSARWLRKVNSHDRTGSILECGESNSAVEQRVGDAITQHHVDGKDDSFSIAIDATKCVQNLEVSSGYGAVLGGEHPKHFIPFGGMSKDEVKAILDGKSVHGDIPKASEVKVAIIIFQNSPPGVPKFEVIAARPQSNNESNDFITSVEGAVSTALVSSGTPSSSFVNFAVDGVSVESVYVEQRICLFLSGKCNHTGTTDPNHNGKSWRYQVIAGGGSVACTIGKYCLDVGLLRLGGISTDLTRPVDFASDHLVLELFSDESVRKINEANPQFGSTREGDKAALALTFFFNRLHLHAINDRSVPAMHHATYLWCSMLWLTSINGASIITKRNIVSEVISFMFIVMRDDVTQPRLATSEPLEHFFGNLRQMIREFTVLEFSQLAERFSRRMKMMFQNSFRPSREPGKGYMASFEDWVLKFGTDTSVGSMEGAVHLQKDGDSVAAQLWSTVSKMITFSSDLMGKLLGAVGVPNEEMSPFCRSFTSLEDLRDEYIRYLPRTFKYEDVQGASALDNNDGNDDDDNDDDDDDDVSDKDESVDSMGLRVKLFAEAMREKGEGDDDDVVEVDEVPSPTASTVTNSSSIGDGGDGNATSKMSDQLMSNVRSLMTHASSSSDFGESLEHILRSSSCLANSKHISGSISSSRKVKSLVERWIARPPGGVRKDGSELVGEDILIERDVIILANVKLGVGAAASTVQCKFRVLDVLEKYYNKWFMSLEPTKKFRKETKRYKVEARMLEVNAMNEYSDVPLYGSAFKKNDIVQNIMDDMIIGVVGKLQAVG